jgi:hypothetical protein
MGSRLSRILALIPTGVFLGGIAVLIIYNRSFIELMHVRSLMALNLNGMEGRLWAAYVIYIVAGVAASGFGVGLLRLTPNNSIIVVGKLLMITSGILWAS